MTEPCVTVVGAGLAGCEAAWQLLKRGVRVRLHDMKPDRMSPAHRSGLFAELVCSNSLRSDRLQNASGLLKAEMRLLDSLVLRAADAARVPAGGTLAVDRRAFSSHITDTLLLHPGLHYLPGEVTQLPPGPVIIATGPLTSEALCDAIGALAGSELLHFFDAAAPIVTRESLDPDVIFRASRYGRGDDYLNCPMNEEEYSAFHTALLTAETVPLHGFEEGLLFEGCLPVEEMAQRGRLCLAFGPMKPVGLTDPRTGRQPFAVVQLRRDDAAETLYNIVGFQTRLRHSEQKRVFSMIPGLRHAAFARFGVMHRNVFLNSPALLDRHYALKGADRVYFAGQISGVEGYVESASSGLLSGVSLAAAMLGQEQPVFPGTTAMGALARYISSPNRHFQPMNVTFGLLDPLETRIRNKEQRSLKLSERALSEVARCVPLLPGTHESKQKEEGACS